MQADATVLAAAIRKAVKHLMPYAVAFDDITAVLPPSQLAMLPGLGGVSQPALAMVLQLDAILESIITAPVRATLTAALLKQGTRPTPNQLAEVLPSLRQLVSGRAHEQAALLGATLSRKIQGARDALTHSADPVSQAASSLIEMIDRLLRTAFNEAEVLAWTASNYPDDDRLVNDVGGTIRPTKRAKALCFVHAGQSVDERSVVHEIVAAGLLATRTALQGLKHADTGQPDELDALLQHLAAVEGIITLAVGLSWSLADVDTVQRLRQRLDPTPAKPLDASA
jgi:hypothetical protein